MNAPMVGKGGFMGMAMPCSSTKKPPTMSEMWRLLGWQRVETGGKERGGVGERRISAPPPLGADA